MLIGLIAAAWALRQRRTHQKAFFELSKGILGIVAENKSIQPSLRPFLVQSMFFDHALRELQHSEARRIEAIRTLAQLDGLEVVAPLISQLSSDYRKVREEAVSALASLSEDAAIELLVSYWREDSNELLEEALLRRGPSIISKRVFAKSQTCIRLSL